MDFHNSHVHQYDFFDSCNSAKNSKGLNYITPFFSLGLNPEHYTIAEALKDNGHIYPIKQFLVG